jgi:AcrR family transcriptional regulator
MAAPPKTTSRDNRKMQVLQEATRIIAERGYHGFGLQELAHRCGMTKAGLLHHFGTKEQLLVEVLEERDRQDQLAAFSLTGLIRPENRTEDLSLGELKLLLRAVVSRNSTQPELIRLFAMLRSEALSPSHPAHDYFVRREAASIQEFARAFEPHSAQPRSVARQLTALMSGLEMQWLREEQGFDLVAEWDNAMAQLLP